MLPKAYRIPSPAIKEVLRKGKRVSVAGLQLSFAQNSRALSRFCVVAALSFDKRATGRNRAKRLVWESLGKLLPKIPSGFDAVIFVRKGLPDSQADVEILLRKLLLLLNAKY